MSETSEDAVPRAAAGRWLPGQSGNPAGKAPGTRNRATLLHELLDEGEDRVIARVVVDKAKAGDAVAARFVIGHLCPRPRARTIEIELAEGEPAHNVVAAHGAVLRALFAGEIAPDEAEAVTRVLDARMRAMKAWGQKEYMMRCIHGFPAMVRPRAAARQASAARARAEDSVPAASSSCISPANAGPEAAIPNAPRAEPDRGAGSSKRQAVPPDPLHSACIGTAATPENPPPDTPAPRELDRALLEALARQTQGRPPASPANGEDSP
jgi:hypothetical protein